jgi:hypothetical protein
MKNKISTIMMPLWTLRSLQPKNKHVVIFKNLWLSTKNPKSPPNWVTSKRKSSISTTSISHPPIIKFAIRIIQKPTTIRKIHLQDKKNKAILLFPNNHQSQGKSRNIFQTYQFKKMIKPSQNETLRQTPPQSKNVQSDRQTKTGSWEN